MIEVKCTNCDKQFLRAKSHCRSENLFCSASCSAIYSNKNRDKSSYRKLEGKCQICQTEIRAAYTYCNKCFLSKQKTESNDNKTLSDLIYSSGHRSNAYTKIRMRARYMAKKHGWNTCKMCGYSKHVEVAHIKPIGSFDLNTLVSVINDLNNLCPLCPNCHWEFDNGLIQISDCL